MQGGETDAGSEGLQAALAAAVDTARNAVVVVQGDLSVAYANPAFHTLVAPAPQGVAGAPLPALLGAGPAPGVLRERLEEVVAGDGGKEFFLAAELPGLGERALTVHARPLPGPAADGRLLVTLEDITERERLHHELVAGHEFTEKLIDSLREAVLVLTPDLRVDTANQPFYRLFRSTPGETRGRPLYALGGGHWDIPLLRQALEAVLTEGRHFDDMLIEHDFEGVGWRRMSLNARRLDHLDLILLTIRDLTEVALARRRIQEADQRLRLLVEGATEGVWELRQPAPGAREGPWARPAVTPDPGLWPGVGWLDQVHPDDRRRVRVCWEAAVAAGERFDEELRLRSADGGWRWMNVRAVPIPRHGDGDRAVTWMGLKLDVHARKESEVILQRMTAGLETQVAARTRSLREEIDQRRQVEQALREGEQRVRAIFLNAPVGMVQLAVDSLRLDLVNPAFSILVGVAEEALVGQPLTELCHPEDRERFRAQLTGLAEGRVYVDEGAWRLLHREGGLVWAQVTGTAILGEDGRARHLLLAVADITARRELEDRVRAYTEELREERNFTATVLDNQPAPVLVVDPQARLLAFNKACEAASGRDFESLRGTRDWLDIIPEEERPAVARVAAALIAGPDHQAHENHWQHRDGTRRLYRWSNVVVRDDEGRPECIIACAVDVTAQREAQAEARRHLEETAWLQRLSTANELAAMVAHEVNQPLASISLYAEAGQALLGQESPNPAPLAETLQRVAREAQRGGEIIRRLRGLVKRDNPLPAPLDVNAVVTDVCDLFAPRAEHLGMVVGRHLATDLPLAMGVPVYVEQVLLNLLANALEAMRDAGISGGRMDVETRRTDGRVRVSVRDRGPGVSAETLEELFEPSAGTKQYGLGMGLRISRSLLEHMEGRLWFEPATEGALFHFDLPLAP